MRLRPLKFQFLSKPQEKILSSKFWYWRRLHSAASRAQHLKYCRASLGYSALHHSRRWSFRCSQATLGSSKTNHLTNHLTCRASDVMSSWRERQRKWSHFPEHSLFGGMLEDTSSWCNSFKQQGSPKTPSNPTELEGVELLCFLWIYRGCGEDPESQPAVLWRFQLPKHFLKTCPEITTASLGYSITTLFCQCLPTISTFLLFFFFFFPSHLPPAFPIYM